MKEGTNKKEERKEGNGFDREITLFSVMLDSLLGGNARAEKQSMEGSRLCQEMWLER
jgi:hypothetical protein